ncbi:MAG: hypothetical protein ACOYJK_07595 [Prevotella sp.]|jgi:hypothetical protein
MKIIEQQVIGKHSQEDCEDGIVATSDFVAVIDGSTSKTEQRINPSMKNGRYCMMLISDFIKRMRADLSLHDFCNEITAHIFKAYVSSKLVPSNLSILSAQIPPHERLCASAIIYSRARRQIWMIGDCQCIIDGRLYDNPKPYEDRLANWRASLFHQCCCDEDNMLDGTTIVHDYARDKILPELIKAMQNQNKTYAVIDGFPIFDKGIKTIKTDSIQHEIVLASDGYPFLKSTLKASEEALRHQLASDPFNIKTFKATKGLMQGNRSFDDRAYIRFIP